MAWIDEYGVTHSADNSFLTRFNRILTSTEGILFLFIPLIILIGIFFIIKKYNKKYLTPYSIISLVIYIFYVFFLTKLFIAV